MEFKGLRQFRTDDAKALGADLQRENTEIERAFSGLGREFVGRWRIVRATGSSVQAKHGDMVLAGFNQNTVVLLPKSSPDNAGLAVRVVQVGGLGAVSVAAASRESVNGVASVAIGVSTGYRDYVDEGTGKWWGPAV
jgi:hypothetical protein